MTRYIVSYQKAFGFSPREEKKYQNYEDAKFFSSAMKRSGYITQILEVKE
jgi:hypothetical protein